MTAQPIDSSVTRPRATADARTRFRDWLDFSGLQLLALVGFLVVLGAVFTSLDARFLSQGNILTIISLAAVIGIVSLGQTVAVISGGFDLSVSGVVPLAGVCFAQLTNGGISWPTALLVAIGIGAVVGLVNGVAVSVLQLNPLIATLGTLSIATGLGFTAADGQQVVFENIDAGALAAPGIADIANQVWVFLGLAVVLHLVLRRTSFGRRVYAVGGNAEAARLAGIRSNRVVTTVYVLCGAFAALAGVILAGQLLTGSGNAGTTFNLQSIAAVVLGGALLSGGKGGVPGTFVGVLILGALANGLSLLNVPTFYQTIATGVVLLLAVLVSRISLPARRAT